MMIFDLMGVIFLWTLSIIFHCTTLKFEPGVARWLRHYATIQKDPG